MLKDIKEKWVKALRSGEYKQGQGRLLDLHYKDEVPRYCCLGVLCDVLAQEGKGHWENEIFELEVKHPNGLPVSMRLDLHETLLEELEFSGSIAGRLVTMNDIAEEDFDTIADEIERSA